MSASTTSATGTGTPATSDTTASPTPASATPASVTSVSVTPEASFGFNVWKTGAGGQSAYSGPTGSGGVKVVWKDPSRKVNPYFRARVVGGAASNDIENQTPAKDAERVEVSDESSSGAEAGEDPFGNDISAESGGENINNIGAERNTFNRFGGELEGGIEHRLADGTKGTTVASGGIYGEAGKAFGVAKVNSYYDGSQNLGIYFGAGLRLGLSHIFKPKKTGGLEIFIGGELSGGGRVVTYSVPGNEGGGNPAVGGVFGGAVVGGIRLGRKGTGAADGTPKEAQPGTLTQADLTKLQKLVAAAWIKDRTGAVINSPGASYFEIDFPDTQDIKDATGRTIDKITFTWDPTKSAWVSQVYVKDNATPVTDSGFPAEQKSIADMVQSLERVIYNLVLLNSGEATKTISGLGTYETPASFTVFKDQEAHLGFVTSPTAYEAIIRIAGQDVHKVQIPAGNQKTEIVVPKDKLPASNLVIDRPFPASIRNRNQGGVELAFDYKVQSAAPPAPLYTFTGISGNSSANGKGTASISFTGTLPAGVTVGVTPTDLMPGDWVSVSGNTITVKYNVPTDGKSVTLHVYSGTNELYTFTVTNRKSGTAGTGTGGTVGSGTGTGGTAGSSGGGGTGGW